MTGWKVRQGLFSPIFHTQMSSLNNKTTTWNIAALLHTVFLRLVHVEKNTSSHIFVGNSGKSLASKLVTKLKKKNNINNKE